ncbi:hypothetical protein [Streptosporangium sp. NPDC051022]|uniref:hypothetical protein n=1 Tax=Streptosporangium sp. NPDC051022 TaxID=3155752 RepID=UPI003448A9DD
MVDIVTDIEGLIRPEAGLATQAALARGGELERADAVQVVRFSRLQVTAEVDDAAACVQFQVVDGALRWYCTCDSGRNGVFCAHCVATAQAVGRRTAHSPGSRTDRNASPAVSSATASVSTVRIAS